MPHKDKYITLLSAASDHYGQPYLIGFMDEYGLHSLSEATAEQAEEYYIKHLGGKQNGTSSTKNSGKP